MFIIIAFLVNNFNLDYGDLLNFVSLIGMGLLWVFRYGGRVKQASAELTKAKKDIENLIEEGKSLNNKLYEVDTRVSRELGRSRENIYNIRDVILARFSEIEKQIIQENTYLKENVKYMADLLKAHDRKIDRLEDR